LGFFLTEIYSSSKFRQLLKNKLYKLKVRKRPIFR